MGKLEQWKVRMTEYEASNETVERWVSKQEGITVYQFHYWKRKLKREKTNQESTSVPPQWTSLEVSSVSSSTDITVRWKDFSLSIPEQVSEDHLAQVMRGLQKV